MKIIDKTETARLFPCVGDVWRHTGDDTLYMRILDDYCDRLFGRSPEEFFASVDIVSGRIVSTEKENSSSIVILNGTFIVGYSGL